MTAPGVDLEQNKVLVRRVIAEVYNAGDLDRFDEFFSPSFRGYGLPGFEEVDRETMNGLAARNLEAFSGFELSAEEMIAEGEKVAVQYRWTGTQAGEFLRIPPTDTAVTVTGVTILRIEGGQIVEGWFSEDIFGLLQQLGAVPLDLLDA